jgi:hypothetical protein
MIQEFEVYDLPVDRNWIEFPEGYTVTEVRICGMRDREGPPLMWVDLKDIDRQMKGLRAMPNRVARDYQKRRVYFWPHTPTTLSVKVFMEPTKKSLKERTLGGDPDQTTVA